VQKKIEQRDKTCIDNWNELLDGNIISCTIFSYNSENGRFPCALDIKKEGD